MNCKLDSIFWYFIIQINTRKSNNAENSFGKSSAMKLNWKNQRTQANVISRWSKNGKRVRIKNAVQNQNGARVWWWRTPKYGKPCNSLGVLRILNESVCNRECKWLIGWNVVFCVCGHCKNAFTRFSLIFLALTEFCAILFHTSFQHNDTVVINYLASFPPDFVPLTSIIFFMLLLLFFSFLFFVVYFNLPIWTMCFEYVMPMLCQWEQRNGILNRSEWINARSRVEGSKQGISTSTTTTPTANECFWNIVMLH